MTGPAPCTAVFMFTYFFGSVAWIWWVVLCVTWFLSAGLRWTHEAISTHAPHFHFVAWLVPTVQTMAIFDSLISINVCVIQGVPYIYIYILTDNILYSVGRCLLTLFE